MSPIKKLYLVSVPIGNELDITLRGLQILKSVDFVICEEFKQAGRLFRHLGIKKDFVSLNEHNQEDYSQEIIDMFFTGKKETAALISDAGTPVFNDPGFMLVKLCIEQGIEVIPIPGASSLMPALAGSGFKLNKFYYAGWLSQKTEIRQNELFRLKNIKELIILYETPYRLKSILNEIKKTFGSNIYVVVAFELTTENEKFFRGS